MNLQQIGTFEINIKKQRWVQARAIQKLTSWKICDNLFKIISQQLQRLLRSCSLQSSTSFVVPRTIYHNLKHQNESKNKNKKRSETRQRTRKILHKERRREIQRKQKNVMDKLVLQKYTIFRLCHKSTEKGTIVA